jgi:hypothetical protein
MALIQTAGWPMVTKSMRGHNRRNSQDLNAIYEALLKESHALGNFKAKPYFNEDPDNSHWHRKDREDGSRI